MRKICILGEAPRTRDLAPLGDPSWEIWSIGKSAPEQATILFEMHPRYYWETKGRLSKYSKSEIPIYMVESHVDISSSIAYPMSAVSKLVGENNIGKPFIECSISYMLGFLMLQDFKDIQQVGLWGVDFSMGEEWDYQKGNILYLLGLLRGAGCCVFVPKKSDLFESNWESGLYGSMDPIQRTA